MNMLSITCLALSETWKYVIKILIVFTNEPIPKMPLSKPVVLV